MKVKIVAALPLVLFLAACPTTPLPNIPINSGSVLADYKIMTNPRQNIPVGAPWLQNSGPNGTGAAPENIRVDAGISSMVFSSDQRASLEASLARFLSLNASQTDRLDVSYDDLAITRVEDIFQLAVSPDSQILYEGVSAKKMTFNFSGGMGGGADANFEARGLPIVADVSAGQNRTITVNGENLFLAYRVMEFKWLDSATSNILMDGTATNLTVIGASGTSVAADASQLHTCVCGTPSGSVMPAAQPTSCFDTAPIELDVTVGTQISGRPISKKVSHRIGPDRDRKTMLSREQEKVLETGVVYKTKTIEFDVPAPTISKTPGAQIPYPSGSCELRFQPAPSGAVVETLYEIRPVKTPVAPGW